MKMSCTERLFLRLAIIVVIFFSVSLLAESVAFARAGGGRSSGSRGFSSGSSSRPSSPTSPTRQPGTVQQPGMAQQPPASGGFGRSLMYGIGGGLLGGMIGSMLFGGRGWAGPGHGGGGFGFGDFIIILIILAIIYFVVKKYRARKAMGMASAYQGYTPETYGSGYQDPSPVNFPSDPVATGLGHIASMDPSFDEKRSLDTFEDMFFRIQSAWTKRDLTPARDLLAPDMMTTFQTDISRYVADHQINRLENVAVRQVEIVYAAQDQGMDYITVKFVASLLDYTVDDRDNKVTSGSPVDPVKFLEYWTFCRKIGDRNWVLSAITQESDY